MGRERQIGQRPAHTASARGADRIDHRPGRTGSSQTTTPAAQALLERMRDGVRAANEWGNEFWDDVTSGQAIQAVGDMGKAAVQYGQQAAYMTHDAAGFVMQTVSDDLRAATGGRLGLIPAGYHVTYLSELYRRQTPVLDYVQAVATSAAEVVKHPSVYTLTQMAVNVVLNATPRGAPPAAPTPVLETVARGGEVPVTLPRVTTSSPISPITLVHASRGDDTDGPSGTHGDDQPRGVPPRPSMLARQVEKLAQEHAKDGKATIRTAADGNTLYEFDPDVTDLEHLPSVGDVRTLPTVGGDATRPRIQVLTGRLAQRFNVESDRLLKQIQEAKRIHHDPKNQPKDFYSETDPVAIAARAREDHLQNLGAQKLQLSNNLIEAVKKLFR